MLLALLMLVAVLYLLTWVAEGPPTARDGSAASSGGSAGPAGP